MDHTHLVQAGDLDRYAPTRESQAIIPELVYWLVRQSCSSLGLCRIPYGKAVNQPGWDGLVEAEQGFLEFVPKGKSYWEIGTGADPQSKATDDFRKRTEKTGKKERADSSFVFVTPRSSGPDGWNEPEQTKWLERRKDGGWKLIRIIDGVKLADWLREYPAIGKWMAKKLNLTANLGGLATATEHWNELVSECATDDPPFPPKLFTVGRSGACRALQSLFEGDKQLLLLFAQSSQDVADFVSGFLAGLENEVSRTFSNRCLYINDEQAWRSIVETRSPHVLIADPRLALESEEGAALQTIARHRGHAVVVPLCGAWSESSPEIIKLGSPSQSEIESVLKEAGYTDTRARELGRIGGGRISALRRHLRGYGSLPPYATWDNASLIAQVGLAGKWDGSNPADRDALEMLLGKSYGGWIEILRPDTLRSDSPLIQHDEKWRFVARGEAWDFLGGRIADADLERFQVTAICVLGERDPQFDLPKEERLTASIHGKVLTHSTLLRKGIAEALALVGSRPKALTSCSDGKAESTAVLVVRELLNKASWDRWASLDSVMPLLAEAAPDEFLDAVESVLVNLENTPFHRLFTEEGTALLGGWNYMSGLLWALESLAWSPDYLSRVSVILADIASFDPGGNWANRPSNSLVDIFLPWHVQTTASFERRRSAVEVVIKEHPSVGWKLLLALLPHNHGVTSGCHRPVWRDFIPRDWKDSVLLSEYWEQITAYTNLAVNQAKNDLGKLCELVKALSDLPKAAHESLLRYLTSDSVVSLPEADRLPIWEALEDLIRHHRRFSDAKWALPDDAICAIEEAALSIVPTSPEFKYRYLFGSRDFELYDEKGNYDEQRQRLDEAREAAILEITDGCDVDSALRFAEKVDAPYEVGRALGVVASNEMEGAILPSLLDSEEDSLIRVVAGFVWTRFIKRNNEWVDAVLERAWPPGHRAKFLTLLPFEEEIWKRVPIYLTSTHEDLYWKNVKVNPYGPDRDLSAAIEKMLEYGREGAAVLCAARTASGTLEFDESQATRALLAVLGSKQEVEKLDSYHTVQLIKRLQMSESINQETLSIIEWNFLPWLNRLSSGSPVTLERRLASDPEFFAEAIGLVFRSRNADMEDRVEPDEQRKQLATNAYKLLTEWRRCPGMSDDGSFNADAFNSWLNEARRLTEESGHTEVAQIQIGHVATCAPPDPDGLWIHHSVAAALNYRDTGSMRSGFVTQCHNDRGVYGFTNGREERELAQRYRNQADSLDLNGYFRFATAMRELAEDYERQADREAGRNIDDDY